MAEGLDDALALAARLPWPAVSAGSRGGFFDLDLARWLPSLSAGRCVAHTGRGGHRGRPHPDAPRRPASAGCRVSSASSNGTTPAEAGGPFAPLDAAAVESSAADLERGGLPTWEARRLASVILGQVLHLADGTLPATREGIPRPAPAGSSPLSDRIGPKPPFSRSTAKTRRAERPVAAFFSAGRCLTTLAAGIAGGRAPQPVRAPVQREMPTPRIPAGPPDQRSTST